MQKHSHREEIEIKSHSRSFSLLRIIFSGFFILLLSKLWFLQIHEGHKMQKYSNINRLKKRVIPAERGLILDREGKPLAKNVPMAQLKIDINEVNELDLLIKKISPIISWSETKIMRRIKRSKKMHGSYHPIVIKKNLNLDEIQKLKLLSWGDPAFYIEEAGTRAYPLKESGSHILGFIGRASQTEVKNIGIQADEITGKSGLEKIYDKQLRGKPGFALIEVDAHNRISEKNLQSSFSIIPPVKGSNIQTYLDKDIQKAAWKAFHKNDLEMSKEGSVIVMKTNGEILAWISSPGFDPNAFSTEIKPTFWNKFVKRTFINKGLQEHYSPGSTFKPFVALAALSEGKITKDQLIDSPKKISLGNKIFYDHSRKNRGKINVISALEESSNTFFYKLGLEFKIDELAKYASFFRFGQSTNIELPGETKGLLPSSRWKETRFQQKWQQGETLGFSIGQGYLLVNLLQLAVAYNAIATEGLIVQPALLNKIGSSSPALSKVIDTISDRIKKEHFKTIKEGLKKVVQGQKGTARWWNIKSMPFSGKTGTAQVVSMDKKQLFQNCKKLPKHRRHHGLFAGYAPSQKPEIVVVVVSEHSCSGSSGAAPIARDIILAYKKKYKKGL